MINIAIVDDDSDARKSLKDNLEKYANEEKINFSISEFCDAKSFASSYKRQYQMVFLDIEMPGVSGLGLAKKLRSIDKDVIIIFVTSFGKYAIKGYEVEALDFIVKPVTYYGLKLKIQRAIKRLRNEENLTLEVRCYDRFTRLKQKDVLYVEVSEHDVVIHTVNGKVETYGSLKKIEDSLSKDLFVRCNHCYLVNLRHVTQLKGFEAVLSDGTVLAVSRAKRKVFQDAVDRYVGGNF